MTVAHHEIKSFRLDGTELDLIERSVETRLRIYESQYSSVKEKLHVSGETDARRAENIYRNNIDKQYYYD